MSDPASVDRVLVYSHATRYTASLSIAEPLTWQPPATCCTHLALPGRDLADIDLHAVAQIVITEGLPVGTMAGKRGTSSGHIWLALERVHRHS